jgi:hypothetical protein
VAAESSSQRTRARHGNDDGCSGLTRGHLPDPAPRYGVGLESLLGKRSGERQRGTPAAWSGSDHQSSDPRQLPEQIHGFPAPTVASTKTAVPPVLGMECEASFAFFVLLRPDRAKIDRPRFSRRSLRGKPTAMNLVRVVANIYLEWMRARLATLSRYISNDSTSAPDARDHRRQVRRRRHIRDPGPRPPEATARPPTRRSATVSARRGLAIAKAKDAPLWQKAAARC